jgi:glucose-1-phosphate adenylyltransferase
MGIYVFNRNVLLDLLNNNLTDFGRDIIPKAIDTHRVFSYVYQGYWEDIGTIRSFFEANLDLTTELPKFNFFDMTSPIFSRPRFLPASKINGAEIQHAILSDGCILNHATVTDSIVGLRGLIDRGSKLTRTIMLGSDFYESEVSILENEALGRPRIGVGENTIIDNTIIDKNARIGNNCVISPRGKPENVDHELYYIRDGILIIPKGGIIPHNTIL